MIKFDKDQYLLWQNKLIYNKLFRYWWMFWGVYAVGLVLFLSLVIASDDYGRRVLVLAAISFILARGVVAPSIYSQYKKLRPYQRYEFQPYGSAHFFSSYNDIHNSFPSGHVISFTAIGGVLAIYFPWAGLFALVVTILVACGRVILGYHYPKDVAAGFVLGALSALITVYIIQPLVFTV
jgi:membrane-associated phospholipid phosphatase